MALQGDGKIVAVGAGGAGPATSRSPATTRTGRSTRASPATAGRRPTSGAPRGRTGWRSRATARSSRSAAAAPAPPSDFALARYNPNGSLDPSFSGDGKQTTDFAGFDGATGVALQGDGKIVAVGDAGAGDSTATSRSPATTRTGRSTRASPATAGRRPTSGAATAATGVALQGDGKIVVVGQLSGGGGDFALARYNPNGSLDTSFSGDGKQTTDFGGFDRANGVALQGDGKIVAVGEGGTGAAGDFALARYNPNGSLDTSFSGDGRQTTDFGGFDEADGVALQGDGKIVAVGCRRRRRRLRARPLQPERVARHELLRRRQADDRLRGLRRGDRGGAPGRRQDRRGRRRRPR